jgi:type I restriction enzyme, R subunit
VALEETLRAAIPAQSWRKSQGFLDEAGRYDAGPMAGGEEGDRRVGVVWHTQGSGKSLTMAFYAGRVILAPEMENPTIVVITDRNDLDDVFGTFARCQDLLRQPPVQAADRADLRSKLSVGSGGVVFTTIQKFFPEEAGDRHPVLSERRNIVVIADEAHRSQYDFIDGFARHMRDALPRASFVGFTGTPIEKTDANTRAVFGEYISIYDIQRAVADGATVPIYYESRLAKLDLAPSERPKIDPQFEEVTEGEEVERVARLRSRWAQLEAIVGLESRLKLIAKDLVEHFENRLSAMDGKAMVVVMSRRIAVALYNEIVALRPEWHSEDDDKGSLKVVMTGSASDPLEWQGHIRNKPRREKLADRFREANDPFKIVIVRDMWLTGFDSPSLHTMYVDKPMRGAPLVQAIARVNRTFRDKPAGLVVDYLGIAEDLKSALADYTKRDQENQDLGQDLREQAIPALVEEHEIVCSILEGYPWRQALARGGDQAYLRAVAGTADWLLGYHPGLPESPCTKEAPCLKCRFMAHARRVMSLFTMCVPADQALAIREDVAFIEAVRASIAKIEGADREGPDQGAELDVAIKQIVSEHISGTGVIDIYAEAGMEQPDLSLIDEGFIDKFRQSDRPNLQIEMLKRLLSDEITLVGKRNLVAGRAFSAMLASSVLRYQSHALDAAAVVAELVELAKQLKHEHERGAELGLLEDEVAFYDAICQNDSAVLEMGDELLKKITRELVDSVRRNATIDWSEKEQVRARMRAAIRRLLIRYGYPPDKQPTAIDLVMHQAELLAQAA